MGLNIGKLLGGLAKKAVGSIPIVGGIAAELGGQLLGGGKAAKTRDTALAANQGLLEQLAKAAMARMQSTAPTRQLAQNALTQVLRQGPRRAPDLRGLVDRANPFRGNFAMPGAPSASLLQTPSPAQLPPPPAPAMPLPAGAQRFIAQGPFANAIERLRTRTLDVARPRL